MLIFIIYQLEHDTSYYFIIYFYIKKKSVYLRIYDHFHVKEDMICLKKSLLQQNVRNKAIKFFFF